MIVEFSDGYLWSSELSAMNLSEKIENVEGAVHVGLSQMIRWTRAKTSSSL
jgi:hypothetical protein